MEMETERVQVRECKSVRVCVCERDRQTDRSATVTVEYNWTRQLSTVLP